MTAALNISREDDAYQCVDRMRLLNSHCPHYHRLSSKTFRTSFRRPPQSSTWPHSAWLLKIPAAISHRSIANPFDISHYQSAL
jgi:hypothetical protein